MFPDEFVVVVFFFLLLFFFLTGKRTRGQGRGGRVSLMPRCGVAWRALAPALCLRPPCRLHLTLGSRVPVEGFPWSQLSCEAEFGDGAILTFPAAVGNLSPGAIFYSFEFLMKYDSGFLVGVY